jgi:hypothetical protein
VTPDAGDRSRLIGERMTAIDVARTVQQQLGIVPVDDALETCHALLAGQAPVVASR